MWWRAVPATCRWCCGTVRAAGARAAAAAAAACLRFAAWLSPSTLRPAGMGDSCCADYSIGAVRELIERELPGVFVHSINTGLGGSSVADIFSSYFGSLNDQVCRVACDGCLSAEGSARWQSAHLYNLGPCLCCQLAILW